MHSVANLVRHKSDPKVIETGPGSVQTEDRLAKSLGWLGIGLGMLELFAARRVTRSLGMDGMEGVVRAFGVREIASGLATLSPDRKAGLWSRVAGDGLDIAVLLRGLAPDNRKRGNVKLALLAVAGVTALDVVGARAVSARRRRSGTPASYRDRSGFPRGVGGAKESAAQRRRESGHAPAAASSRA